MGKPSPFHVRIVQPDRVRDVLSALLSSREDEIPSEKALAQLCHFRTDEALHTCRALGLVETRELAISDMGLALAQLIRAKPGLFSDIMHFLYHFTWDENESELRRFSWSYGTVCDLLWKAGSTEIDRNLLASQVVSCAQEVFATDTISFSQNSISGVLSWLRTLNPSVISEGGRVFNRRNFCAPELFALAVDYLYRKERIDYQSNLLLDDEKQQFVCRVCLLDPTAFDAVFDWAAGQYPFLQKGSSGGWGSYILLTRKPQLTDFLG